YDALGRRITETHDGVTTDLYYSDQWQVLEERQGGVVKAQNVWSRVYVDALVERDRDLDGNSSNGMEERLYAQQDANWNVTALVNASGQVVERYAYEPYGQVTVLDANWSPRSQNQSAFAWVTLHQGQRHDWATGYDDSRERDYSRTLGRW